MNVWMKSFFKKFIFTLFAAGIYLVVDYFFIPESISELVLKSLSLLFFVYAIYLIVKYERNKGDLSK